jgi:hypothetical protein
MAHFAKLGINSKVMAVHVLNNDDMKNADGNEDETVGQQRLQEIHGWPAQMWIQTSYNTKNNKYYNADGSEGDQSKKLRGNYAGIGYTYDEDNDIFWPKQPYASWTKNTSTASWDAPITSPSVTTYTAADSSTQPWLIYWDEAAYQANNSKGWEATKEGASDVFEWNGSAWVAQ